MTAGGRALLSQSHSLQETLILPLPSNSPSLPSFLEASTLIQPRELSLPRQACSAFSEVQGQQPQERTGPATLQILVKPLSPHPPKHNYDQEQLSCLSPRAFPHLLLTRVRPGDTYSLKGFPSIHPCPSQMFLTSTEHPKNCSTLGPKWISFRALQGLGS